MTEPLPPSNPQADADELAVMRQRLRLAQTIFYGVTGGGTLLLIALALFTASSIEWLFWLVAVVVIALSAYSGLRSSDLLRRVLVLERRVKK